MSIVTDATVVMKRAEEVLGELMAANAQLRRQNAAMLEALETIHSELQAVVPNKWRLLEFDQLVEAAIRMAKGITQ